MRINSPNPMILYDALQFAFDRFDEDLFGNELRHCLITVQRRRTTCGFFAAARFRSHDDSDIADEIGLDPQYWGPPRSDAENLSVLVHEMCHLWQHYYGKPSRNGYHNRQFFRKMQEIGLTASATGEKGGKRCGQRMSHYITPGGPFERVCNELLKSGFVIPYHEIISPDQQQRREWIKRKRSRAESKTTYVCPNCDDVRAWGKPGLLLACRVCDVDLEAIGSSAHTTESDL
jgi:predicted SprT family Zn-dependent metalloprotease